jgi:site-specific DNA-methyltransferase (adenine-specific)
MKKYQIIYADPPWSYKVWSEDKKTAQGCAKKYYQTMSIEDICNLKVSDLADKDCKLFLWATPPCLPEALRVMKAWGFEYKTIAFCWVKTNPKSKTPFYGIGHWTASNCELVLAGLRKGGKLDRQSKSISQIDMSARGKHSVKPDSIRNKIVELCGDVPRIELFARKRYNLFGSNTDGWDVWGNEVESDINLIKDKVGLK